MSKNKIMDFFSSLGRSLLMPIAALAACGIILGLTSALMKAQVQAAVPFLAQGLPLFIISSINKAIYFDRAVHVNTANQYLTDYRQQQKQGCPSPDITSIRRFF